MKFYAASVPRPTRAARLSHLRTDAVIGMWHIKNPSGSFQVFDVIMQPEADFLRMKNHLAAPAVSNMALAQGQVNGPYILKDIKEVEVPDDTENPALVAADHFRKEFNLPVA